MTGQGVVSCGGVPPGPSVSAGCFQVGWGGWVVSCWCAALGVWVSCCLLWVPLSSGSCWGAASVCGWFSWGWWRVGSDACWSGWLLVVILHGIGRLSSLRLAWRPL